MKGQEAPEQLEEQLLWVENQLWGRGELKAFTTLI